MNKPPTTNSIIRHIAKNSDVFDKGMKKIMPVTDREMVRMALDVLIDSGYTITDPNGIAHISTTNKSG